MPLQVVNSAQLMCSQGMAPSMLVVLPTNRVFSGNQPAANIMAHIPMANIMPFGISRYPKNHIVEATAAALGVLTPMPCVPAISALRMPGAVTVLPEPSLARKCMQANVHVGRHHQGDAARAGSAHHHLSVQ